MIDQSEPSEIVPSLLLPRRYPAGKLFLGLDSSTQGLKATLVDDRLAVIHAHAINYQRDLSGYGTTNGVVQKAGNVVVQPTAMVRSTRFTNLPRNAHMIILMLTAILVAVPRSFGPVTLSNESKRVPVVASRCDKRQRPATRQRILENRRAGKAPRT